MPQPVVPAGKRLVISYVTTTFEVTSPPAVATRASLIVRYGNTVTLPLPTPTTLAGGRYTVSAPVIAYAQAGTAPAISLYGPSLVVGSIATSTITGYLEPQ